MTEEVKMLHNKFVFVPIVVFVVVPVMLPLSARGTMLKF